MASQTSVVKLNIKGSEQNVGESLFKLAMRRLRRDKLTIAAIVILLILTLMSVGAPLIADGLLGVDYARTAPTENFLPMGAPGHLLGTDDLGRDVFARLLYAGQVSLGIGFTAAFISIIIGLTLGVTTGYYGGVIDDIMNWVISTLDSIPSLFLLLIIAALFRPGPLTLILVLGFLGWTGITRLARGETLSIRAREYIISARAIGASPLRIMFVHIVPNLFSVMIISLMINIGGLILTESALSFLGLGVLPPTPSWGNMLSGAQELFTRGVHLMILPGMLIFITVLCLYIVGDGLRDAFDPTARKM